MKWGDIFKGVGLGLALFVAWVAAMALIALAALHIEYVMLIAAPAAFIAFGITVVRDRRERR